MTVNTGEIRLVPVRKTRVRSVLRVTQGERWVGDILVDGRHRVWRHADTIPRDVVLKVFLAFLRQDEPQGEVFGRDMGWAYSWSQCAAE